MIFHITFFTFILSRPFIDLFRGEKWWIISEINDARFAMHVICLTLLMMFLGANIVENFKKKVDLRQEETSIYKEQFNIYLQNIALIVFLISSVFGWMQEIEKLVAMQGQGYLAYYTNFQSNLPALIHVISSFSKYALCVFLATGPTKKKAFFPLALFWMSALPSLVIGIRNPIMLNSLFIFVYYFYRDAINRNSKKWIGKFEKGIIIISTPFVLAFMAAYTNIRSGGEVALHGIGKMVVDFFYGQGVTFNVLMMGYRAIPSLPQRAVRNYTFGGIIDYYLHGSIGQRIFHTAPLPQGNNIVNALQSNNFSHNMSYASLGEEYLGGKGWGSSYLLEVYTDFGYIGVAIFSLLLGIILVWVFTLLRKNVLVRAITLVGLTSIFFSPRAEATGWLTFLFTIQFWVCAGMCILGAGLCVKRYSSKKGGKKCLSVMA